MVTWDPWVYHLKRDVSQDMTVFSRRQIYTLTWLLVTRREVVQNRVGTAEGVLRGYQRAIEQLQKNPAYAVHQPAAETDLPADYLEQMPEKVIFHLGMNWSLVTNIEQAFDWLKTKQGMGKLQRPTPDLYLAPGPLSRVAPENMLLPDTWMAPPDDGR